MKFVFILTTTLSMLLCNDLYSQKQSAVTPTMARKISLFCQYNNRALILFTRAAEDINPELIARTDIVDRIVKNLDKHLDYAEGFIIVLYNNYGVEMSYHALNDAYFTTQEIDKAEEIWKKKNKEREIAAKKKAEQRERDILTRIEKNDLFISSELSKSAEITIDIGNLAIYINSWYTKDTLDKQNPIKCSFDFIVSKNRELSLKNPTDTLSFSQSERLIYQYVKNISKENIQPAIIELKHIGKTVNANSVINLQFNERMYFNSVEIDIEKNKKTKQWEIKNESSIQERFKEISQNKANNFYTEFEKLLYSNSSFTSIKKGRYTVQFEISDHRIMYTMDKKTIGEGKLKYSFGFAPPKSVQKDGKSFDKWLYGSSQGNSHHAANSGMDRYNNFSLGGRTLSPEGLSHPAHTNVWEEGIIVVDITVNSNGEVIHAAIGKGTNIDNARMRKSALEAAKKAKFNPISETVNQSGTITYMYRIQ